MILLWSWLFSTAGLRTLSRNVAEEILEHCRMAIERTAFVFREEWALIISGKEEGKFGWIAANYLMERFTTKKHLGQVSITDIILPIQLLHIFSILILN